MGNVLLQLILPIKELYIETARIYVRKCSSTKTDYANVQVVLKEIKCAMSDEGEIII